MSSLAALPGFRRRFRISPRTGMVCCELEDDFHCMSVIPLERQSDASRMPAGNCYTFQPEVSVQARRIGRIRDFSVSGEQPLAGLPLRSHCP